MLNTLGVTGVGTNVRGEEMEGRGGGEVGVQPWSWYVKLRHRGHTNVCPLILMNIVVSCWGEP